MTKNVLFPVLFGAALAVGVSYRNRRDTQANSARTCGNQESTLLFDKCWFCACEPCQMDLLFLVDQSDNAEPQCDNVMSQFGLTDDVIGDQSDIVHTGAKAQVDFV